MAALGVTEPNPHSPISCDDVNKSFAESFGEINTYGGDNPHSHTHTHTHTHTHITVGQESTGECGRGIWKGVVTHVPCRVTSSSPIASIFIRENWKMPRVMNRYICYKAVGDMYVGRCVSGQDRMGTDCALSNRYFDFSHLKRDKKEAGPRKGWPLVSC